MKPILPMPPSGCRPEQSIFASQDGRISGLTKRELFAGLIMAVAVGDAVGDAASKLTNDSAAIMSVSAADALIRALNENKGATN